MWRWSACHQLILLISVPLANADYAADLSGSRDHDFEMSAFVQTQSRVHLSASAGDVARGDIGNLDHQPRLTTFPLKLPPFSKLSVDNGIRASVAVGDATTVSITMVDSAVYRLIADVKGETLHLGLTFGYPFVASASAIITVTKPLQGAACLHGSPLFIDTLNGPVSVAGGSQANIKALDAPSDDLHIDIVQGSHLEIGNLNAASATISSQGGSHVKVISGTSQSCSVSSKDGSLVNLGSLNAASSATISSDDGSHLDLGSLNATSATITSDEGSFVKVTSGTSQSCAVGVAHGAKVDLGSLNTLSANISATDGSKVSGMVAEKLKVTVTSGSHVSTSATGSVSGLCNAAKITLAGGGDTSSVTVSSGGKIIRGPKVNGDHPSSIKTDGSFSRNKDDNHDGSGRSLALMGTATLPGPRVLTVMASIVFNFLMNASRDS